MLTKRNFSVNRQEIHFKYSKVKFPFRHSSLSMADLRLLQAKRFSFVAPNKQVQVAFNTRFQQYSCFGEDRAIVIDEIVEANW